MHVTPAKDFSTVGGILVAILFIIAAIAVGGASKVSAFWDLPSLLIVVLGTFAITIGCFSLHDVFAAMPVICRMTMSRLEDPSEAALKSLRLAEIAYRKGLLVVDRTDNKLLQHSEFLHYGAHLVMDGTKPEIVEHILIQKMQAAVERHSQAVTMIRKAGELGPAMGLIGTLIGLVQMLGVLSDPERIGPAMATALLTTFYGAFLSYIVLFPLASKLDHYAKQELLVSKIYTRALVSIALREHPQHIEALLNDLLPASKNVRVYH
jgi:chemotaxis protein MotA